MRSRKSSFAAIVRFFDMIGGLYTRGRRSVIRETSEQTRYSTCRRVKSFRDAIATI